MGKESERVEGRNSADRMMLGGGLGQGNGLSFGRYVRDIYPVTAAGTFGKPGVLRDGVRSLGSELFQNIEILDDKGPADLPEHYLSSSIPDSLHIESELNFEETELNQLNNLNLLESGVQGQFMMNVDFGRKAGNAKPEVSHHVYEDAPGWIEPGHRKLSSLNTKDKEVLGLADYGEDSGAGSYLKKNYDRSQTGNYNFFESGGKIDGPVGRETVTVSPGGHGYPFDENYNYRPHSKFSVSSNSHQRRHRDDSPEMVPSSHGSFKQGQIFHEYQTGQIDPKLPKQPRIHIHPPKVETFMKIPTGNNPLNKKLEIKSQGSTPLRHRTPVDLPDHLVQTFQDDQRPKETLKPEEYGGHRVGVRTPTDPRPLLNSNSTRGNQFSSAGSAGVTGGSSKKTIHSTPNIDH